MSPAADPNAATVPFHAAAVGCADDVVLLAGPSGSGKSTVAAAAVLAGWGYLADEVCAVSPTTLVVHPDHRPIGLRRAGAVALGLDFPAERTVPGDHVDWPVDPARLAPPGRLHTIALVEWVRDRTDEHTDRWSRVDPAQAMVELLQHLVAPDDVAACFAAVDTIVRRVPIVRLRCTTPACGVALLDDLLVAGGGRHTGATGRLPTGRR